MDESARLLAWNRFWLTLFIVSLLAWVGFRVVAGALAQIYAVKTHWNGDTLVISAINGHKVVTHLVGTSPRGNPVAAIIGNPRFLLDSEGGRIEKEEYEALTWRNEGGAPDDGPPLQAKVQALYVQLDPSDWQGQ